LDKQLNTNLSALKSLGDLASTKPVIVCDTREQSPLTFTHFQCVRGTLQTGDYSIVGLEDLFSI
jgi:DNA excision repair protein ERCC-4